MAELSKVLAAMPFPSATSIPTSTSASSIAVGVADDPGALTANVWKEVLNINGSGFLHAAFVRHVGSTSQRVGIRVTIDGTVVASVDESVASTQPSAGVIAGFNNNSISGGPLIGGLARFNNNLRVEVRSDISTSEPRYSAIITRT